MEVYFVRHTQVDVPKGTCYGHTDVPLKASFPEEAEAVKQKLAGLTFDASYSSPLSRARKLAAYCGYPDPIIDDRLIEMNYGEWEMQKYSEIKDPRLQEWYDNWQTYKVPGGESCSELFVRVMDFIEDLKKTSYERVVVFCHGGILISASLSQNLIPLDWSVFSAFDYGAVLRIEI
ncbi:MAG: alpha-ribazole phosphatase [Bacteroidales bacterium]|nr:alpha-ribazole phosphatase [Bacteroidales bacterium]